MDTESIVDQSVDTQPSSYEAPVSQPETSSAPQAEPSQGQPQSPWEAFRRLPDFQGQDDRAIAARLYNAMEREKAAAHKLAQYQQILPYAQEYLTHRRPFQEWMQNQSQQTQANPQVQQAARLQAQQPQPAQQPQQSWWNPPKVRDAYKRYLTKDETGREVISEDAPLDARHELMEYQQYRADFARKFLEDPQSALGPMVENLAKQQAEQIVQERFQMQENESFVANIEEQNRDWLFDKQTGNVTPEGLLVHKFIEEARERGIKGPQARWDYAVAMAERQMLAQAFDEQQSAATNQLQQSARQFMEQAARPQPPAQPPAPPQPQQPDLAKQNMEYLRREAARNPSRSAGTAVNDTRASKPKMTFEQMLREDASTRGLI
jgi:hypothetical protein